MKRGRAPRRGSDEEKVDKILQKAAEKRAKEEKRRKKSPKRPLPPTKKPSELLSEYQKCAKKCRESSDPAGKMYDDIVESCIKRCKQAHPEG